MPKHFGHVLDDVFGHHWTSNLTPLVSTVRLRSQAFELPSSGPALRSDGTRCSDCNHIVRPAGSSVALWTPEDCLTHVSDFGGWM